MGRFASFGISRLIFFAAVTALIIVAFWGVRSIQAANPVVQTFYIPLTEDQIRTWEYGINTAANDTNVYDVISITATMDGTIIYYDQWEDGYEADISNPVQSTTQILGDGNASNGAPPGCSSDACDVINAGTVIALKNVVPLVGTPLVRDQGNIYFDARDKIASTGQLVITRTGWLANVGTVFAGAVEVQDTRKWGTSFVVPVGVNSNTGVVGTMFNYSALSIMAKDDNTTVQVGATPYNLNQGQSVYISNVTQGTVITASSPIQVDMMTGMIGSNYEGRWFTLIPQTQWSNSYYCPVSTVSAGDPAAVIFYNPGAAPITVNVATTGGGLTTVTVPGSGGTPPNIASYNMPQNTAAHFYTTGSPAPPFFAFFTNDYNQQAYEWAAMMIPETSLTPSVVVGWAPGSDGNPPSQGNPPYQNDSPVWVTPVSNTTIYVNYSGNPNIGPNTDPYGNKYDVSYNLNALQSQRIANATTFNMTGSRIYTVDGTRIAAFWGEDASSGVTGLPAMDLGTAVLPFPSLTAYKTAALIGDFNSNGGIDAGELIQYTVRVHNSGIMPITNIVLTDMLDPNVTYVANTTGYSTSQSGPFTSVPDNPLGTSPLAGGFTIVASPAQLNPGQDIYVTFQVTVNNPLPQGINSLLNTVTATSTSLQQLTVVSENFTNVQNSVVRQGSLATVKTASPSGMVKPGDTIAYTITVTNTSSTPQTGIQLNDPVPAGATYVPNSTVATGHQMKYVNDMFNQLSYSNNDGPQNWAGNWSESDAGAPNPLAGNVQVTNGSLRLTATNSWAARTADLTSGIAGQNFTSATLSFDFRTSPSVVASDAVAVEMSNDGTTFTTLDTFTNITGQTSGTRSYGISSYISANTTVRFRTTSGYTGASDFFYVDNVAIKTNELPVIVTKDNITGGGNPDLINGGPPNLVMPGDGFALAPGETLTVTYSLSVNNPATASRITNTVTATSEEQSQPASSITINPVGTGGTIGGLIWLDSIANGTYDYGEPVLSNIRVWLDANGNGVFDPGVDIQTLSGTDGGYIFSGLLPGTYVVHVDESTVPAGLTLGAGSNPTSPFTVTDQELFMNVNFGYVNGSAGAAIIGNYIWSDANNNGIQDPGESGLGNVTVQLLTSPGGTVVANTTTNAYGAYLFTNIAPGTYIVQITDTNNVLNGYTATTGPQSIGSRTSNPLTAYGEYNYLMEDFGFHSAATYTINDRVWFDLNNSGTLDSGEPGIKDVTVILLNAGGNVVAATSTDVYGSFTFSGVPNGGYTIKVTDTNGALIGFGGTTAAAHSRQLSVTVSGANISGTNFGYNAPGRIGYRVWQDTNGNGLQDSGEQGISGVTVQLYQDTNGNGLIEPGTDQLIATTTTDSGGNYMFQVSQAGRYFVSIDNTQTPLNGLVPTTTDDQAAAGYQKTITFYTLFTSDMTANFGFKTQGGQIGHAVWNDVNGDGIMQANEQGIPEVSVRLYQDTNGNGVFDPGTDQLVFTTTTDATGSYGFQVAQTGTYFVSIDDSQPALASMIPTTADSQTASGIQQTVNVTSLSANYLSANFGFYSLASDLGITKTANPSGAVSPGGTITYTITITNNSATTTQTGISVTDPLPTDTTFVSGSASGYQGYITQNATLNAVQDTYINLQSPNTNYGTQNTLSLQYRTGRTQRPLAQFDLSSIPANATVNSASMQFYVTATNANLTANVYRLTNSWTETGATWNRRDGTNYWTTLGGDYDSGTLIGSFVPNMAGYHGITGGNLISLVQNWINGTTPNYGVILNGTATSNQTAGFSSREAANDPQLTVNYTYLGPKTKTIASGDIPNIITSADGFRLPPGQTMTITYQVTVGSTPNINQISNTATVSSSQSKPSKASVSNPVTYTVDLQVTKTLQSLDAPCHAGTCNATFLITVNNAGTSSVSSAQVTDILPAGLSFSSATATAGTYNGGTGIWNIPTIPAGGSSTLTLSTIVQQIGSTIQNCANLTSSSPADSNSNNNSSCVSITPTHVILSGFRAYEDKGRMAIEWTTSSENDTAGFYLLRKDEKGDYLRINNRILPGLLTSPQGGTYSLIDTGASPDKSYTYILVEIEGRGSRNVYGPFTVKAGKALSLEDSGLSKTISPLLLNDSYAAKTTTGSAEKITSYLDKTGVFIVTNVNGLQGRSNSPAKNLFSDYTRKANEPSDDRKARIEELKETKKAVPFNNTSYGKEIKVSVSSDELYYLDASKISGMLSLPYASAIDRIKHNSLILSSQGSNVAYMPSNGNTGILFYGQGIKNNVYTNDNVYWVSQGAGLQMEVVNGKGPAPSGANSTFKETLHIEEDLLAVPVLFSDPEADYWFWDYIVSGDPSDGIKTFTVQVNGPANVSSMASVTINLHGFTNTIHHVIVRLNGTSIGVYQWEGAEPGTFTAGFSQGILHEGANDVEIEGSLDEGSNYDIFYVDSFDLTYQRLYQAAGNTLTCRGDQNPVVTITGFTTPQIMLFDITDAQKPELVKATTISGTNGSYSVSFNPSSPSSLYLAVTADAVAAVTDVNTTGQSVLKMKNNSADYLIITTPEMKATANLLASYRKTQRLMPMVVVLDDIMDEFNYGIYNPKAIRDFLSYAFNNWNKPPRYVLLAGNGTYDYKNNLGEDDNLIPTLMSETPSGLYPSDNLFANFNGSHIPEIAVGRLPVLTASDLQNVINKIITFESSAGIQIIMLADNPDGGGDFPLSSDEAASLLPQSYSVEKIYLSQYPIDEARMLLMNGINSGTVFLNYIGHGGVNILAGEGLLKTDDIASMTNRGKYPVLAAMTCSAGQFAIPGYDSISEALLMKKDAGAAAVWAPTGLSYNSLSVILDEEFLKAAFSNNKTILGDVILKALSGYVSSGSPTYVLDIYNLLGDPALKMR